MGDRLSRSEACRKPASRGWDVSLEMEIVLLGGEDPLVGLHLDNPCEVVSIISVLPAFTSSFETIACPSLLGVVVELPGTESDHPWPHVPSQPELFPQF